MLFRSYAQSELKSFMSHLIFNAEKNYEYLFYRYATDLETFTEAQDLSKKETIESFKENLEQSPFLGYIIADGEIIDLNKYQSEPTPTLAQLSTQNEFTKNYISNTAQFNPWGWNIILLYNDNQAMKIANSNALLIVIYSTGLILIFILITALMLKFAVYSPLKKILNHFGNLNEKNNETNLELYGSKETFNIARNINIIAKKILDRERELISQKERYTNIINSQHSIIFVITRMQITRSEERRVGKEC